MLEMTIDFSQEQGHIKALHGVNMGPSTLDGFMDLSAGHRELGFPTTRLHDCQYAMPGVVDIHCIFPNFDADPDDPNNYYFAQTDDYLQDILEVGSQIIYRLGETIEWHKRRKFHITAPAEPDRWARICRNIARHYNDGWANGFYHDIRYWEVWNEPYHGLCWIGTDAQYFALYDATARELKAFDPTLKIGGPAGADYVPFAEAFVRHCREAGTPLDFFSWHAYPTVPHEMVERAHGVRALLDRYGFTETEIHLNEWNYMPEGWDEWGPHRYAWAKAAFTRATGPEGAAFIASALVFFQDAPLDMTNFYWGKEGFWGLFDAWGLPCTSYYGMLAFRRMLDTPNRRHADGNQPEEGVGVLAGANDDNTCLQALISNFASPVQTVTCHLTGLPWPQTRLRWLTVDDQHPLEQTFELTVETSGGTLTLCQPLPAASVGLLICEQSR